MVIRKEALKISAGFSFYCITSALECENWLSQQQNCDGPLNTEWLPHEKLILFTLIFTSRALKCRWASIKSFQVWMKTLFEFFFLFGFYECMIYQFMTLLLLSRTQSSDIFIIYTSLALFTSIYPSQSTTHIHTHKMW